MVFYEIQMVFFKIQLVSSKIQMMYYIRKRFYVSSVVKYFVCLGLVQEHEHSTIEYLLQKNINCTFYIYHVWVSLSYFYKMQMKIIFLHFLFIDSTSILKFPCNWLIRILCYQRPYHLVDWNCRFLCYSTNLFSLLLQLAGNKNFSFANNWQK